MDRPQSNLDFRLMSLTYKFRDFFAPRVNILNEVGIRPGVQVLDYGCGPGSYIIPLAQLVGESGKIYALDIHPLAIEKVRHIASRRKIANLETIQSDCKTGLADNSIDVILLYDIFHDLGDPNRVLQELHRVLKPNGILSFSDHHMREIEVMSRVTTGGLFTLSAKGKRTYSLSKEG